MKTFNTFKFAKFAVLGLLLLSFISALLMLPAFLRNSRTSAFYLLDAAKAYVAWDAGKAVVNYAKAISDDIRIFKDNPVVAYVKSQDVIPDFGFSSPDAILTELSKLPSGENLVVRDDRGIQYMFAAAHIEGDGKIHDAFVATKLYHDVFSRGLSFALLIVNFIALAASLAILWNMYKAVTRYISRISSTLQDLPEVEKQFREDIKSEKYPLWEMKELTERLCDFLQSYKELKELKFGKFKDKADKRKMSEHSAYLEQGQRVAAEFTLLRKENSDVDFYLAECDWDDFDALTDTMQSRIAALLREAVEYAVKRDSAEIYLSLQDDEEDDMMILEIRDDGHGFNEGNMPEPMKGLIDESRAEGFGIEIDSRERARGCVLKVII